MPIYEYECGGCGESHEFIQKFSDGPKRKCPSCGALKLKKQVSAAAFHLKGSGWYVTDFRDKGKEKDKGEDKKSGDSAGADSKSTETKTSETKSSDSKTETASKKKADSKKGSKSSSASADAS